MNSLSLSPKMENKTFQNIKRVMQSIRLNEKTEESKK